MPPLLGSTTSLKRTIFTLFLGVFLIWTSAYAEQQAGRVLDRNGESQGNCQIAFYVGSNQSPVYRATSNNDGNFYLNDPRMELTTSWFGADSKQFSVTVTIDASGLHPRL